MQDFTWPYPYNSVDDCDGCDAEGVDLVVDFDEDHGESYGLCAACR